jgi:hypothetical protein
MIPLLLAAALAAPGNEVVLILDNSCSMVAGGTIQGTGEKLPPNDPERAAVLGALLVEGLARGSEDDVTVIGFGDRKAQPPRIAHDGDAVRAMEYGGGTWFDPALRAAADVLRASSRDRKLLVLFTDGSPSDLKDPAEAVAALAGTPTDTLAIGLYASPNSRRMGQPYLSAVVREPSDLTLIDAMGSDAVQQVVRAFTNGYAHVLGSKPVTGTLDPAGSTTVQVGRYVTEVLVAAASVRPGSPFELTVTGPAGAVPARATGDNSCPPQIAPLEARRVCDPPRRHYAAWRGANDPYQASSWTLNLARADGQVEYGIILRYDLVAEVTLPPQARVGEPVPIEGRLLFRGQVFQDDAFFQADGFAATLEVGESKVPLEHAGAGRFRGVWTPDHDGSFDASLVFSNQWMRVADPARVAVEGFLDLTLRPEPDRIDLGAWQGDRRRTQRCQRIDLSRSVNADRVPVVCEAGGYSSGATLTCGAVKGSEATVNGQPGQPLQWEVCVQAEGCCEDLPASGDSAFSVTLRGAHAHYAPGAVQIPVSWKVDRTGFLRCWWPVLAAIGGLLTALWALYGMISPYSFDPSATVRVAGNPTALRRASALVLCEQPGGRRGFYRNARLCLLHDGTPVRSPGAAILVLEAGPRGTTRFKKAVGLERLDRRTDRWQNVPDTDLPSGFDPNTTYRIGGVHLRFG